MENYQNRYKYSCRDCPIRQQCIDEKPIAPSVRLIVASAFRQQTDTNETWNLLQGDCVLVRQEQARGEPRQESEWARRLRLARQPQPPPKHSAPPPQAQAPNVKLPLTTEPVAEPLSDSAPANAKRLPEPITELPPEPHRRLGDTRLLPEPPPPVLPFIEPVSPFVEHGLIIQATHRLVRLPYEGALVLGRSEYGGAGSPDVDLTCEKGAGGSVSHYHSRVIGEQGQHWIEAVGSIAGIYLNGKKLPGGERAELTPGTELRLGECRMVYTSLPRWVLEPDVRVPHISFLTVTRTGQCIELPDKKILLLGRANLTLNYVPDIDLSSAGDMAQCVSRKHVRLTLRWGKHFIQDLNSTNGTRLNGCSIRFKASPKLLHPGDHLWLGGCVLAYEWQLI